MTVNFTRFDICEQMVVMYIDIIANSCLQHASSGDLVSIILTESVEGTNRSCMVNDIVTTYVLVSCYHLVAANFSNAAVMKASAI